MGSASSASLVQINAIETSSARTLLSLAVSARVRQCAACWRHSFTMARRSMGPREDVTRQMGASSYRKRPKGLYEQNRFAMGPSGQLKLGEDLRRPGFQNRGKGPTCCLTFARRARAQPQPDPQGSCWVLLGADHGSALPKRPDSSTRPPTGTPAGGTFSYLLPQPNVSTVISVCASSIDHQKADQGRAG